MDKKDLLINMLANFLECDHDIAAVMVNKLKDEHIDKLKVIIENRICTVEDMRRELARFRHTEQYYDDLTWENEQLKTAIIKQVTGVDLNDKPSNMKVV